MLIFSTDPLKRVETSKVKSDKTVYLLYSDQLLTENIRRNLETMDSLQFVDKEQIQALKEKQPTKKDQNF